MEFAENFCTRIADVERMVELSTSRLNDEKSELSNDVPVRSILKAGGQEAPLASPAGSKKTVRFALQEPDPAGQERSSGEASGLKTSNNRKRVSTMRSAHDTQPLSDSVRMEKWHLGLMLCTRRCPRQQSDISPTTGLYPAVL